MLTLPIALLRVALALAVTLTVKKKIRFFDRRRRTMGACFGKCFGGGGGGGSGGYSGYTSAGPQPSVEERRAAALAAAEERAKSQALRGVSGSKPTLSPTKTDAGGRNTREFSDAATWN